jgi:hypothetical protein
MTRAPDLGNAHIFRGRRGASYTANFTISTQHARRSAAAELFAEIAITTDHPRRVNGDGLREGRVTADECPSCGNDPESAAVRRSGIGWSPRGKCIWSA